MGPQSDSHKERRPGTRSVAGEAQPGVSLALWAAGGAGSVFPVQQLL